MWSVVYISRGITIKSTLALTRTFLSKFRDTAADLEQIMLQSMRLDRRRLEEGFLLYASLEILNKYNLGTQIGTFPCNKNELVEIVTKESSPAFLKKWEGKHNN